MDQKKNGTGAITIDNVTETLLFNTLSAQQMELLVAIEVFKTHHEPFNLFSDSKYVVNAVQNLELTGLISLTSTITKYLQSLQKLIWDRKKSFFYWACTGSYWPSRSFKFTQ